MYSCCQLFLQALCCNIRTMGMIQSSGTYVSAGKHHDTTETNK